MDGLIQVEEQMEAVELAQGHERPSVDENVPQADQRSSSDNVSELKEGSRPLA